MQSYLMRFLRNHWPIILALAILAAAPLILMQVIPSPGAGQSFAKESLVAEVMSALTLTFTLGLVYIQINHIRKQNELQRNVASKSAIQVLNEVILKKENEDFLPFLFPTPGDHPPREMMMAFSLMNSLEMLYMTQDEKRRKDKKSRGDFKNLLEGFTKNVLDIWEQAPTFATVYHPDFREIVQETFNEMKKKRAEQAKQATP